MYEYKGELCPVIKISKMTGVPYGALLRRLNEKHWSLEKAIETPIRKQKHPEHHTCILDGKIVGVEKVARRFNLNSQSVRRRINRGETLQDVVNNPVRRRTGGKSRIHLEYKGRIYSVRELSEQYNISIATIRTRLSKGWSVEKIVETPVKHTKLYDYEGKKYTARELYDMLGSKVSWEICKNRLRYGWSIERAISKPCCRRRRKQNTVVDMDRHFGC